MYNFIAYGIFVIAAMLSAYSLGHSYATFKARKRNVARELNNIANMRALVKRP